MVLVGLEEVCGKQRTSQGMLSFPRASDLRSVTGWFHPKAPAPRGRTALAQPGTMVSPSLPGLWFNSLEDDKKVLVGSDRDLD